MPIPVSLPTTVTPPPPAALRTGLIMTWIDDQDVEWPLQLDGGVGGLQMMPGVRGLHFPQVDRYTSVSPAQAGSTYRGSRANERECLWPLALFHDGQSADWVAFERAFWRGLQPGRVGTWRVYAPDGSYRELICRGVHEGDVTHELDPVLAGWATYGVALVAEQPFWAGKPETRTFDSGSGDSAPSGAFVLNIKSSSTLATATINNPGDVDAYGIYTITAGTGGITSVDIGAGDALTRYSATIPAGQTRTIDMRPDRLTVVDQDGNDRISDVTALAFDAPIPAGQPVPLTFSMVGNGTVRADVRPLYWRAYA